MRIAIVSPVVSGVSGGYRKYVQEIVPLMAGNARVSRLDVYASPAVAHLHCVEPMLIKAWPANDALRGFPWLKSEIRQVGYDVVFVPTAFWLDCGVTPVVMMVRNTEPLMIPFSGNSLIDGFKNILRARFARQACRNANRVIAVSHHVRDFLVDNWHMDPGKIEVVYHGVEQSVPESDMTAPDALTGLEAGRFIFTAGSIRPARGLEDIIKAMPLILERDNIPTLVIAGKVDDGSQSYKRRLDNLARRSGVAAKIVWPGHLEPKQMAWCYRHCEMFVMTSRAEACPNTALEALSHGCHIVSTTQPPMPEFFEDCAAYYQPGNAADLAEVVASALDASDEVRQKRRMSAIEKAAGFNWSDTARHTLDQLELTIDTGVREQF